VGAVGTPGEYGVESRGGWTQAQFNFKRRWQVNLGYGIEVPNASQLPVGNPWRNQTYMGNVIFKLTPNVLFAWNTAGCLPTTATSPLPTSAVIM